MQSLASQAAQRPLFTRAIWTIDLPQSAAHVTTALPSAKRRKGRRPLPDNPTGGHPLTLRDAAQDSPLFNWDREGAAEFDEVPDNSEGRACAVAMAAIAHETKGEDVLVLHVAPLVSWTDFMVFVTVFSRPQLEAILDKVEGEALAKWDRRIRQGGKPNRSEWEVLDLGDVIVHVFTEREREYFDLETFYRAAEKVQLPFQQNDWELSDTALQESGNRHIA